MAYRVEVGSRAEAQLAALDPVIGASIERKIAWLAENGTVMVHRRMVGMPDDLSALCKLRLRNGFASDSFDAAIAIESSEHMPDLGEFFRQAARVLRPGGKLVVCAWLSSEHLTQTAVRWLLEPICRDGRMPHLSTANEYETLARRAGFQAEQSEDVTRQVQQTWPAIVRRLIVKFATAPQYLRFLFKPHAKNRIFALTILRIWIAYRVGAMRYGIFTFVKR